MGKKKHNITHGQIAGIAWLSIGILIIAGIVIFRSHDSGTKVENDSSAMENQEILDKKEDSVYCSRYAKKTYQRRSYPVLADSNRYGKATQRTLRQPLVVELNSADTTTLMLLHGIGPTFANRIVRYRNRLGGFIRKEQLLEVYGFTPELLDHIEPYLHIEPDSLRRIPVNSIPLKQLVKHPYIEYYQARDIVNLRNRGVRFSSVDDLRAVPSMADSTLDRLLPYLSFE